MTAACGIPQGTPTRLGLPPLAGASGEVVDSSALRFVSASALEAKRKPEEEEKEKEKEKGLLQEEEEEDAGGWFESVDAGRTYF